MNSSRNFLFVYIFQFLLPIFLMLLVSFKYFKAEQPNSTLSRKIITSSHGLVLAILYSCATVIAITGNQSIINGRIYSILNLLPLALIAISFIWYKGPKELHFLQLLLLPLFIVTYFFGLLIVMTDSF